MDGGAWWAAVHGVAKSRTRLRVFTFTFHFHALEKEMATHSSILAWRIPGIGAPGGLPSRVRHNWSDLAAAAAWHLRHYDNRHRHKLSEWHYHSGTKKKSLVDDILLSASLLNIHSVSSPFLVPLTLLSVLTFFLLIMVCFHMNLCLCLYKEEWKGRRRYRNSYFLCL